MVLRRCTLGEICTGLWYCCTTVVRLFFIRMVYVGTNDNVFIAPQSVRQSHGSHKTVTKQKIVKQIKCMSNFGHTTVPQCSKYRATVVRQSQMNSWGKYVHNIQAWYSSEFGLWSNSWHNMSFWHKNKCQDLTNLLCNIVQLTISSSNFSKICNWKLLPTPFFLAISPNLTFLYTLFTILIWRPYYAL